MSKNTKEVKKKVVGDVKSFVVDRSKWLRGEGSDDSCLLTMGNRMCCLGFYAEACGLDRKVIRNLPTPTNAVRVTEGELTYDVNNKDVTRKSDVVWKTKLSKANKDSATCQSMMDINDDQEITDKEREAKLTSLFKKIGVKVKFK